jgi:hypothetical protein
MAAIEAPPIPIHPHPLGPRLPQHGATGAREPSAGPLAPATAAHSCTHPCRGSPMPRGLRCSIRGSAAVLGAWHACLSLRAVADRLQQSVLQARSRVPSVGPVSSALDGRRIRGRSVFGVLQAGAGRARANAAVQPTCLRSQSSFGRCGAVPTLGPVLAPRSTSARVHWPANRCWPARVLFYIIKSNITLAARSLTPRMHVCVCRLRSSLCRLLHRK